MDKRYQVFLSSTFKDLQEHRKKVFDVLMKMNCIPAGMELFPAADDEQFEFIKRVIDDCDYYLLIIAGRYGSPSSDGMSFTQKEYQYALHKGIKVLSFLHHQPQKIPLEHSETEPEATKKLEEFRKEVSKGRLVSFWETPDDLASKVILSVQNVTAAYPATGWVRGDIVSSESAVKEILMLRTENATLHQQLLSARVSAPEGARELSQGDDQFQVAHYFVYWSNFETTYIETEYFNHELSWNRIFALTAPALIDEGSTETISKRIQTEVTAATRGKAEDWEENYEKSGMVLEYRRTEVVVESIDTIIVQLRALGLIERSTKKRGVKDIGPFWTLTTYGDLVMTQLMAVKRWD